MKKLIRGFFALAVLLLIGSVLLQSCGKVKPKPSDLLTLFEESGGTKSATYHEGINWWEMLDKMFDEVNLITYGKTDHGEPLHLAILSDKECTLYDVKESHKRVLLINNAIHPGEPDGVDASMMLFRDILTSDSFNSKALLKDIIVVAIPYYNVGGALNRNSHSRANQNGPEEYGFRGNAQNLDLNRDFIKADSRNAETFIKLIQHIDPELYIETHVSNGADYQYTMTLLPGHYDKLGKTLGKEMENFMERAEESMKEKGHETCPYVHTHKQVPDSGIISFYDSPRYSTGYLATLGIPGIITETHMLKPYEGRVVATYEFLSTCTHLFASEAYGYPLDRNKENELNALKNEDKHVITWDVDMDTFKWIDFNGYEFEYKPSEATGKPRLSYDRSKPFTKKIRYYNHLKPVVVKAKPKYYLLKRGYVDVEQRLRWNKVKMEALEQDTIIDVIRTKITDYKTPNKPYEKHYAHHSIKVENDTLKMLFRKGDWVIPMGTTRDRFVMEVLEPEGPDSYFSWNFFDAVLQQKEWYSPYVFEDEAAEMLKSDPALARDFEEKKMNDPAFGSNAQYQLYWLYQRSAHYEKEHMVLPVFKVPQE